MGRKAHGFFLLCDLDHTLFCGLMFLILMSKLFRSMSICLVMIEYCGLETPWRVLDLIAISSASMSCCFSISVNMLFYSGAELHDSLYIRCRLRCQLFYTGARAEPLRVPVSC